MSKHKHRWIFQTVVRKEGQPTLLQYLCVKCLDMVEIDPHIPAPPADESETP